MCKHSCCCCRKMDLSLSFTNLVTNLLLKAETVKSAAKADVGPHERGIHLTPFRVLHNKKDRQRQSQTWIVQVYSESSSSLTVQSHSRSRLLTLLLISRLSILLRLFGARRGAMSAPHAQLWCRGTLTTCAFAGPTPSRRRCLRRRCAATVHRLSVGWRLFGEGGNAAAAPPPGPVLTPPPPLTTPFPLVSSPLSCRWRAEADRWRVCEPTVHSEVNLQLKFRYTGSVLEDGGRTVLPHCLEWEQRDTRSNKILNREVWTINWHKTSFYILVQTDSCPSQPKNE